jgi:type I restriction enzyme R subunit
LNTLYLDKKLRYHGLIQAFSRTNRIHGPKKPFGNIVSFLTKKDDVDEAVYLYSQSDNTDIVIQKPYYWYVDQARKQIQILRIIAPNLKSIDKYQSEADYKTFVEAFKAVARIISMLENFIEFKFTAEELGMNKQEFEDYKSKYFDISRKASIEPEKTSVLKDVDFEIDLLTSDKINVDYILKLIANLSQSDRKSRDRDITRIINIIKQNDTPELHSKMELLRKFIERIVPTLKEDDFVEEKYNEFIKDERLYAIKLKSEELKVEADKIINMIEEFQFSGVMPNEVLRKNIEGNFLDKTKKLNSLREFIREVSDLYV